MIGALGTFFGVLFILLVVIAVMSKGALKGSDVFVLRWVVLSLTVAFSGVVAWLRWSISRRNVSPAAAVQSPDMHQPLKAATGLPPFERSVPLVRAVASNPAAGVAAAHQAIVFRQHFPPLHDRAARSFFGGTPIAPRGFRWPRSTSRGSKSKPFSFLMQMDCAAVPPPARLGMLPDRGILYFFLDLTTDAFRVTYHEAEDNEWESIPPPDDLAVAYEDHPTAVWRWPQAPQDCPKLLPKWTFDPVAVEIPREPERGDEDDSSFLWSGGMGVGAALRAAQGEEVPSSPFTIRDCIDATDTLRRPFAGYPHDWRAVQIGSGLLLAQLRSVRGAPGRAALRELSEAEREAVIVQMADEARVWYGRAVSHPPFSAVASRDSDEFWSWLARNAWLVRFVISDAITLSIEASLAESTEAAARIPADVARRLHYRHALASRSEAGLFVTTPDRMLGAPVDVQGRQVERMKTHLLLLELSSNDGLGHHFGEAVYQFWITPDDLSERRFDSVELTVDAY